MRLRLWDVKLDKEIEEPKINPFDIQFYNENSQPMLEWVEATKT